MSTVALYGKGGHAKVIAGCNTDNIKYYEGKPEDNQDIDLPLIIAVGDNATRKMIVDQLPKKTIYTRSNRGLLEGGATANVGTVLMRGSIVQANTVIGKHSIINTGATVDHDCVIGDYAHIAPGVNLCGNVSIGEGVLIGVGASVIPGIKIGKWATVGAGSVVIRDVPDGVTVAGNPAKQIIKKAVAA